MALDKARVLLAAGSVLALAACRSARARRHARHPGAWQLRPAAAEARMGGGRDHSRPDPVEDTAGHQEHLHTLDGPASRRRPGGAVRPGRGRARHRPGRRASALVLGRRAVGLRHVAVGRPGGRAHRPGQHPFPADRAGRGHRGGPVVAAPALAAAGGLVIYGLNGRLAGYDDRAGRPRWTVPGLPQDPVIQVTAGLALVTNNETRGTAPNPVTAVVPATGRIAWRFNSGEQLNVLSAGPA